MSDSSFRSSPIEPIGPKKIEQQGKIERQEELVNQIESEISMTEFAEEGAFEPTVQARRFESLEDRLRRKPVEKKNETEKTASVEEPTPIVEDIHEIAENFERENPELNATLLEQLIPQAIKSRSPEELLKKVMTIYPDHFLADEALEFLSATTSKETKERVKKAKEELNSSYGREVRAGRNITSQAREFSTKGLGSPLALRDLYRDITGNPRQVTTLFDELYTKFGYKDLGQAIDFFLHSLGADLKAKGPSISPAELHRLVGESRSLLAILGVFQFFEGRMNLIRASFERAGMLLPIHLTFELLARLFVDFLKERYPSIDKVLQLALKLGISSELLAQIILFTQMRDAVRGIAPKLFRHEQHRYDVLMAFIEAIEEIEEEIEEIEEEEQDKEKKKNSENFDETDL